MPRSFLWVRRLAVVMVVFVGFGVVFGGLGFSDFGWRLTALMVLQSFGSACRVCVPCFGVGLCLFLVELLHFLRIWGWVALWTFCCCCTCCLFEFLALGVLLGAQLIGLLLLLRSSCGLLVGTLVGRAAGGRLL